MWPPYVPSSQIGHNELSIINGCHFWLFGGSSSRVRKRKIKWHRNTPIAIRRSKVLLSSDPSSYHQYSVIPNWRRRFNCQGVNISCKIYQHDRKRYNVKKVLIYFSRSIFSPLTRPVWQHIWTTAKRIYMAASAYIDTPSMRYIYLLILPSLLTNFICKLVISSDLSVSCEIKFSGTKIPTKISLERDGTFLLPNGCRIWNTILQR